MHYFSEGLSRDNVLFHHQSAHAAASTHEEDKPFEPTAEIEAQTIGNLLPDEDDLFADVFNELDFGSDAKGGDNAEDFDLFSSVGGMELEGDDMSRVGKRDFDFAGGVSLSRGSSNGLLSSKTKLGSSWTGDVNQFKSTNDIVSSQSMFGGFKNGSLKGLNSTGQNLLSARSSSILNSFPSSLNLSPASDFGLPIPNHSSNLLKFGGRYTSSSQPCSFTKCENDINNFIPHENLAGSITSERMNFGHISLAGPNRQLMEPQGGLKGQYGNSICSVHGHPWSNCYLFHNNSLGHKIWPNSPLLSNIIYAPSPPQRLEFSGSFGNMRHLGIFPRGSSTLSYSVRNSKKVSNDVTMNSSPQTANSLGSTSEFWRNISRRRNHGNYSNVNKKEFELDIERILRGKDGRTTLMLKNIPNKYSSKMLLGAIDEHCKGIYDFVYLPIDFKNNCNVGYAFINLIDPLQIVPFYKLFNGKKWEKFNSEKVAALAYARIQGKAALIAHFQNSSLMNEDKDCRPVLFCTDGPNAGKQEPFPVGTNIRVKNGKARGSINEENRRYHGSPSTSPDSTESNKKGSLSPNSVIV